MKQIVCLIANFDRSFQYGIGRYIQQLTTTSFPNINLYLLLLNANVKKVTIGTYDLFNKIEIPAINEKYSKVLEQRYYRSVCYFLKEEILTTLNGKYIFHINIPHDSFLPNLLRKLFNCKILSVIHYSKWSYTDILGNESKLLEICNKSQDKKNLKEQNIEKCLNSDLEQIDSCDKIIFIAQHSFLTYKKFRNNLLSFSKVIYNGIEDSYSAITQKRKNEIRHKYLLGKNEKIIIFAGRLDSIKGIYHLLDSFNIIAKKHKNIRLIIAGDGDFNKLMDYSHKNWSRVLFTGRLSQQDLYEMYQIADIGVVCSLFEEFGYVAIEMMMHRLPIIVTDTSGLSEIVTDNFDGLKVPILHNDNKETDIDCNILSNHIVTLLSNNSKRNVIAKNARKTYLKKYTKNIFTSQINDMYQTIFNEF